MIAGAIGGYEGATAMAGLGGCGRTCGAPILTFERYEVKDIFEKPGVHARGAVHLFRGQPCVVSIFQIKDTIFLRRTNVGKDLVLPRWVVRRLFDEFPEIIYRF